MEDLYNHVRLFCEENDLQMVVPGASPKLGEMIIIGGGVGVGHSRVNMLKSRALTDSPNFVFTDLEYRPGLFAQSKDRLSRHIKPKVKRHLREPQKQVMRVGRWYTSTGYADIAFGDEFYMVPRYAKFRTARQAKAYFNKHPAIIKVMKTR